MSEPNLRALVTLIGLLTQTAITALLWLFFLLLKQHGGRRAHFFKYWTYAWGVLLAALLLLGVGFYGLPNLGSAANSLANLLMPGVFLLYQLGKLLFLLLLVLGTLEYAEGKVDRRTLYLGMLAALVYCLVSFAFTSNLQGLLLWQAVVCAAALGYATVRILRLPYSRRSLGTRVTGVALKLLAVLWVVYALAIYKDQYPETPYLGFAAAIRGYDGYLDTILQLMLAFGMVLMILEDARRETNAAHAELAVAHEKLLHESLTDPLTNVYNRLAFTRGVFLQTVGATFGSVFIFDLDNLKHVNDSHGHEAGDELLKHFVMALRGGLRPADQLYRWGGDEFLLLLPGATYASVAPRLNQLLYQTSPLAMFDGSVNLKLEVSMGGADYQDPETLRAAVNTADRAMYEQKRIHKTAPPPREPGVGDAVT
ncbi:MAG TPA: GGDEF domain-containing protein [Gammaproteobacteria bacterium]|nr:GGDEF domain-containing protein [Gammaproteobacteria bacterium]